MYARWPTTIRAEHVESLKSSKKGHWREVDACKTACQDWRAQLRFSEVIEATYVEISIWNTIEDRVESTASLPHPVYVISLRNRNDFG